MRAPLLLPQPPMQPLKAKSHLAQNPISPCILLAALAGRRRCTRKHAVQHSATRLRAAAVEVTHHVNAMHVVAALGADVALLREIQLARRASLLANVCYSSGDELLFAGARHPVGGMGVKGLRARVVGGAMLRRGEEEGEVWGVGGGGGAPLGVSVQDVFLCSTCRQWRGRS